MSFPTPLIFCYHLPLRRPIAIFDQKNNFFQQYFFNFEFVSPTLLLALADAQSETDADGPPEVLYVPKLNTVLSSEHT